MGNRPLSVIGTAWDNTNRNAMEQNRKDTKQGLDELAAKDTQLDSAISTAQTTANNAMSKANEAKTKADSVQNQVNDLVVNSGNSSAEVVQMRTDENGVTYTTAKDRVDSLGGKVSTLQDFENLITSFKKGTTETSDSKRIQRAFDASIGKSLKFSRTTYTLDETLKIPSNIKIDFNGAIFQRKAGTVAFDMIVNSDTTNGNSDIYLENLLIDGNKEIDNLVATTVEHRFSGLKLVKVTNSVIKDIKVTRTVNGEDQANNPLLRPAAGIYFIDCDMRAYNVDGYNNDRTAIFLSRGTVRINGSKTYNNLGSGISSTDSPYSEYVNIETYNNGYTNLSVNGIESKVNNVRSWGSKFSGVTIGHGVSPSHKTQVSNVISFNNEYEGITIGGSIRPQFTNIIVYGNKRDNIRVFDGASKTKFLNVVSHDSFGSGIRYYSGIGHILDDAEFYENHSHGIYADVGTGGKIGDNVQSYNNGKPMLDANGTLETLTTMSGILLNQAINWTIGEVECFDDQATKTQDSGLWIAGGSSHRIRNPNLYNNKTAQIKKSSSPTDLKEIYPFPTSTNYINDTAINGWTSVAFRHTVKPDNVIDFEGVVSGGSSTNAIFYVAPVGQRPNATQKFVTTANGAYAEITVNSAGEFVVSVGSNLNVSLATVKYKAVQ